MPSNIHEFFMETYLPEEINISGEKIEEYIVDAAKGKNIPNATVKQTVAYLKSLKLPMASAKHTGRLKSATQLNKNWKGKDKTPKTDITIGDQKMSVKYGPSQLMSGGMLETLSTFEAAASECKNLKKDVAAGIESVMSSIKKGFVERGKTKGEVATAIGKDSKVTAANDAHKKIQAKISNIFNSSEEFKTKFVKEAMSGRHKFSTDFAIANSILAISDNGAKLNPITDAYARKIASQAKISIRFKSTSEKIGGEKTGMRNYWSVMGLITPKITTEEETPESYLEGIMSWLGELYEKVKEVFNKGLDAIMEFFGLSVSVQMNNSIEF